MRSLLNSIVKSLNCQRFKKTSFINCACKWPLNGLVVVVFNCPVSSWIPLFNEPEETNTSRTFNGHFFFGSPMDLSPPDPSTKVIRHGSFAAGGGGVQAS